MAVAHPDLNDAFLEHLGAHACARLVLCCRALRAAFEAEAENYRDFKVYGLAVQLLFKHAGRIFQLTPSIGASVRFTSPVPFDTVEQLLAKMAGRARRAGCASFRVTLSCEGTEEGGVRWESCYRVYATAAVREAESEWLKSLR